MKENDLPYSLSRQEYTRVASLRTLQNFDGAFDGAFSLLAYTANRFLIDHMLRVGRLLTANDFESMVLWGVLAHQNVAHLMPPGSLPTAVLTERGRLPEEMQALKPLLLRDIAAITGIPRETARRKLEQLAEKRYVRRTEAGWVVAADRVEPDLRDFTRDTVMRLVAVCDEILQALHDADARATSAGKRPPR